MGARERIIYLVHICIFLLPTMITSQLQVRIVTWNVDDNLKMSGVFKDEAIDKVLGLDLMNLPKEMPDLYVIGLQQECWKCNGKNLPKLADRFKARINEQDGRNSYEIVGVGRKRETKHCEEMCTLGSHGTLVLIEIARKGTVKSHLTFNATEECTGRVRHGIDTGVIAAKLDLADGKAICFANVHLDPDNMKMKMSCLENFFKKAEEKSDWTTECDAHFLFGDFNTKTGKTSPGNRKSGIHFGNGTRFSSVKRRDQMSGILPYDSPTRRNLLGFINAIQKNIYREGGVHFLPTYQITDSKKFCEGEFPCYNSNEPLSWTDRILHTNGKRIAYESVYAEYGQNFPVFAEYEMFGDDTLVIGQSRKMY